MFKPFTDVVAMWPGSQHDATIFNCGLKDVDHFRRHRASKHQGPKSYACTYCGKSFATQHEVKAYERREENPAMHMCDTCNMFFPRQFQLQKHMATHSSENKYTCNCGKTYKHKYSQPLPTRKISCVQRTDK
ncbi:RB-associated KRAB zinc finger protein-like [Mercenaria mercenaria]|uniref:RB-associated KRAB zinc finger protein-like n=1 Tax=Mercenaria mercenaria TaxID=6596 RepID=UPI00234EAE39|nr:RB-associated KRAB zinc finger protein-like [Mercenaria mercenaria]